MNDPRILSRHRVGHLIVDRFLSRFGTIVWFVVERCTGEVLSQGTRKAAVACIRSEVVV